MIFLRGVAHRTKHRFFSRLVLFHNQLLGIAIESLGEALERVEIDAVLGIVNLMSHGQIRCIGRRRLIWHAAAGMRLRKPKRLVCSRHAGPVGFPFQRSPARRDHYACTAPTPPRPTTSHMSQARATGRRKLGLSYAERIGILESYRSLIPRSSDAGIVVALSRLDFSTAAKALESI